MNQVREEGMTVNIGTVALPAGTRPVSEINGSLGVQPDFKLTFWHACALEDAGDLIDRIVVLTFGDETYPMLVIGYEQQLFRPGLKFTAISRYNPEWVKE